MCYWRKPSLCSNISFVSSYLVYQPNYLVTHIFISSYLVFRSEDVEKPSISNEIPGISNEIPGKSIELPSIS